MNVIPLINCGPPCPGQCNTDPDCNIYWIDEFTGVPATDGYTVVSGSWTLDGDDLEVSSANAVILIDDVVSASGMYLEVFANVDGMAVNNRVSLYADYADSTHYVRGECRHQSTDHDDFSVLTLFRNSGSGEVVLNQIAVPDYDDGYFAGGSLTPGDIRLVLRFPEELGRWVFGIAPVYAQLSPQAPPTSLGGHYTISLPDTITSGNQVGIGTGSSWSTDLKVQLVNLWRDDNGTPDCRTNPCPGPTTCFNDGIDDVEQPCVIDTFYICIEDMQGGAGAVLLNGTHALRYLGQSSAYDISNAWGAVWQLDLASGACGDRPYLRLMPRAATHGDSSLTLYLANCFAPCADDTSIASAATEYYLGAIDMLVTNYSAYPTGIGAYQLQCEAYPVTQNGVFSDRLSEIDADCDGTEAIVTYGGLAGSCAGTPDPCDDEGNFGGTCYMECGIGNVLEIVLAASGADVGDEQVTCPVDCDCYSAIIGAGEGDACTLDEGTCDIDEPGLCSIACLSVARIAANGGDQCGLSTPCQSGDTDCLWFESTVCTPLGHNICSGAACSCTCGSPQIDNGTAQAGMKCGGSGDSGSSCACLPTFIEGFCVAEEP
ncbi:MAG: hypothetical protein AB7O68_25920 [Pirellulales bacterium]